PVQGFALYGGTGFTATFTGALNAGSKSSTTTFSYSGVNEADNKGWNLVGNPYPCSIDWDASSGWTKTNINDAIYLHVDNSTWATYVGGAGVNGGTRYIAPSQGFFVRASAAGELAMTDAVKVHHTTAFFKSSNEVYPKLVRLEISGNVYKDEALVKFNQEATLGFDGNLDACKLFGDVPEAAQVYSIGETNLAINTLPETSTVPVGIRAGASGTYTIRASEINDLAVVNLEDTKTGIFTNLLIKSYTFNFGTGENEQRFLLHFGTLGVDKKEKTLANIYGYQKTVYIDLKDQLKGDAMIYNMSGQLITSASVQQGLNRINLQTPGVYVVKVITERGVVNEKVWID
ncbi:MAG: T9SS type A sorting domain-containing protein, partial [Bacteroidota bacterium]